MTGAMRGGGSVDRYGNPIQPRREASKPRFETSPTGEVFQWQGPRTADGVQQVQQGGWVPAGTVGGALTGSGTGSAGSGGGGSRPDLSRLISQLKTSSGSYVPAPPPRPAASRDDNEPYAREAETAAYGRAKERTGLATQAALRGLSGRMAQRGIRGSTIEGDLTGRLFEGGLGQLADTDRQLAEKAAERAFGMEQFDLGLGEQQRQYDANYGQNEAQREQQAKLEQLQKLISVYGMAY